MKLSEEDSTKLDKLLNRLPRRADGTLIPSTGCCSYGHVEDLILKLLGGKRPAKDIGELIGRTQGSINQRLIRLGVDGRLRGEDHQNAKLSTLQVRMIQCLSDAGFTPAEIRNACFSLISYKTIYQIAKDIRRTEG